MDEYLKDLPWFSETNQIQIVRITISYVSK